MMGQSARSNAILMGDLVDSERTHAPADLHRLFNAAIKAHNRAHKSALLSPLTITLGDEFQGIASSLTQAAFMARALRLALMADGIDCRFAIGQAVIATPLNPSKAWNMMGPGLAQTRRKLNDKKSGIFYRFALMEAPVMEAMLDALGAGLSMIERQWTRQQRYDIAAQLGGMRPDELARQRGVSVHTIYKVRNSGDFNTYVMQWDAIEGALRALDEQKLSG